jgi:hypothetical protein
MDIGDRKPISESGRFDSVLPNVAKPSGQVGWYMDRTANAAPNQTKPNRKNNMLAQIQFQQKLNDHKHRLVTKSGGRWNTDTAADYLVAVVEE